MGRGMFGEIAKRFGIIQFVAADGIFCSITDVGVSVSDYRRAIGRTAGNCGAWSGDVGV